MATHNETGKKGEELAVQWLKQKGFEIIQCNWRYKHWEIDIIASKNNLLHFIEVKTRRNNKFGFPEESVSKKKLKTLMNAADIYLHQNPQWKRIQFDVLSITLKKNCVAQFFFIEDVYLFND